MQRVDERVVPRIGSAATAPRAERTRPTWLGQVVAGAALGLTAVVLSLVFWPGSLDADALGELQQVATGRYSDWHVPVLEALWRIPYLLGIHGPGWLLPVSLFTLLVGFYLLLRCRFPRLWSTVLAIGCCLFPPVLTWAVHIGADAWFAASIIAAFGFAARCFRTKGRGRALSVVGSVWFAAIAMASRHNAIPAVVVVMIVLAALALDGREVGHRKLAALTLGVVATISLYGVESIVQWATGTVSTHPVESTMYYDLVQLSKAEHRVLLPPSADPKQGLQTMENDATVININGLVFVPNAPVLFPVEGPAYAELKSAWEKAVLHDPRGYLEERLRLGLWLLSIDHPATWLFTPSDTFAQYGPTYPTINTWGYDYLEVFTLGPDHQTGDLLYDGWIYAVILLAGAVILLRQRAAVERVVGAMSLALLMYGLGLVFTGPGEMYRYIYPMVAAATVVAVVLLSYEYEGLRHALSADRDRMSPRSSDALLHTISTRT